MAVAIAACGRPQLVQYWPGNETWSDELQIGDYAIYEYTGSTTPVPVLIRKELVERRDGAFVIDVVTTRGSERRHWIEVLAAPPRDVRTTAVLALFEVDADGTRKPLINGANADLDRLYGDVPVLPELTTQAYDRDEHIGRWPFACTNTFGETEYRGDAVKVSSTICRRLPWRRWEHAVWTNDESKQATIKLVDTGRGGYARVACADGTTHFRNQVYGGIEEGCMRSGGVLHGAWEKRDDHGTPLVAGRYVQGKRDGMWSDSDYTVIPSVERCLFRGGKPEGYRMPLHWTHLRLGTGIGIASLGNDTTAFSALAQVGWDLWSPKRECYRLPLSKPVVSRSLAAIVDMQLIVTGASTTPHIRLGLQGYPVVSEGFLPVSLFASAGAIVFPRPGVGLSIGTEYAIFRMEVRYDYLGRDDQLASFMFGVSDGLLAAFD